MKKKLILSLILSGFFILASCDNNNLTNNINANSNTSIDSSSKTNEALIISSGNIIINDKKGTLTVANNVESFNFNDTIRVSNNASWKLSKDIDGSNILEAKTSRLEEGLNTFYIIVKSYDEKIINVYTIEIFRAKTECVLSIDDGTSKIYPKENYLRGDLISNPGTPTKDDYKFLGWYYNDKLWDFENDKIYDLETTLTAKWQVIETEGLKYTLLQNGTYQVTGFGSNKNLTSLVIPKEYNGKKVSSIAQGAFFANENYNVKKIIIQDNIEEISEGAFFLFDSLEEVILPDNLTKIGAKAFWGASKLKNINLSNVTIINESAFDGCSKLQYVDISKVTEISKGAFRNCFSLSNITINDNGIYLREEAFSGCKNLNIDLSKVLGFGLCCLQGCKNIVNVELSDKITSLARGAFKGCSNLESIKLPSNLRYIGDEAFSGCYMLNSIELPNSVTKIGNSAFYYCNSLKTITLSNSLTEIGAHAFDHCTLLKQINLTDSITSIGSYAFSNCESLEAVTLPKNITTINDHVFYNCNKIINLIIPDNVTSIGACAFSYSKINTINISDKVEVIADNAFAGCDIKNIIFDANNQYFTFISNTLIRLSDMTLIKALDNAEIISGVKILGNNSFEYVYADTIVVPDSVEKINQAFSDANIKNIILPDIFEKIDSCAFSGNELLESVTLGDSIKEIGSGAFSNCISLKTIKLPDNLVKIDSIFEGCTNLETVTMGNLVTIIDDYSFENCKSLKSITLSNTLETIGDSAFMGCESLQEINLPSSLKTIDYGAFYETGLKSIIIPDSVTYLGDDAFYKCANLTSVALSKNIESIGVGTFYSCISLKEIEIFDGTKSFSCEAFENCKKLEKIIVSKSITKISYLDSIADINNLTIYFRGSSTEWENIVTDWNDYKDNFIIIYDYNE